MTPQTTMPQSARSPLIGDLMASLVVFTIALPLPLGIAGGSGTSPVSGVMVRSAAKIESGARTRAAMIPGPVLHVHNQQGIFK